MAATEKSDTLPLTPPPLSLSPAPSPPPSPSRQGLNKLFGYSLTAVPTPAEVTALPVGVGRIVRQAPADRPYKVRPPTPPLPPLSSPTQPPTHPPTRPPTRPTPSILSRCDVGQN